MLSSSLFKNRDHQRMLYPLTLFHSDLSRSTSYSKGYANEITATNVKWKY